MTEEQLSRIEGKVDQLLQQTATHAADLFWLKRVVGLLGSVASGAAAYLWRKNS